MARQIHIPQINPFKFVPWDNTKPARYQHGHLDKELQINLLRPYQDRRYYYQKVQRTDRFRFTLSVSDHADMGVTLTLVDSKLAVIDTLTAFASVQVPGNLDRDGVQMTTFLYREADFSAATTDGVYFLRLLVDYDLTESEELLSEPLSIKDFHPNTMMLEVSHSINKDGVYFEQMPVILPIRVEAAITDMKPASSDTVYEDQGQNLTQLYSTAFRSWTFNVGHTGSGIPDWMLDKLNRLMSCDRILIEGKQYLKAEGANWTKSGGDILYGAAIDIREAVNDEDATITEGSIDIYTSPGYPYAVALIQVGGFTISDPIIIADSTAETAFIATLNADLGDHELFGTIAKVGSVIRYTNAAGESFTTAYAVIHTGYIDFEYNPIAGPFPNDLTITTTHSDILVDWGHGSLTRSGAYIIPVATVHSYPAGTANYDVRLWGTFKTLNIGNMYVDNMTGNMPSVLQALTLTGVSFASNTFPFATLANCATNLTLLSVVSSGLTAATGMNAINFTKLRHVDFSYNPFSTTVKSAFHYDVWLNSSNNAVNNGTFNITQSPYVPLNASGNYYKSALQSTPLFWTVNS